MALLALGFHVGVFWGLRPRCALGDEADYLSRADWDDPHAPRLFLRVPAVPALVRWVGRRVQDREAALRCGGALIGVLSCILVALSGLRSGDLPTGLLAGLLMLILVERVILAAHLWPDNLLCGLHGIALILLLLPHSTGVVVALGAVAMLATLVRIEQLALAAGLLLVLVLRDSQEAVLWALLLFGPTLLSLAIWTAIAWRRYRIALPDTTWLFNLRILHGQLQEPEAGPTRVQSRIAQIVRADRHAEPRAWHLSDLLQRPVALFGSMLRRLAACFGPDTFVSGRLLPPMGTAYPEMSVATASRLATILRWSFPLLAAVVLWAALATGHWPDYLLATAPVLLALTMVHFRSRYRLVLMPWFCLWGAEALLQLGEVRLEALHWLGLALLLLLAVLHVRHPLIVEHDDQIGTPRRAAGSET